MILIAQDGDELRAYDAGVIGIEAAPPALLLTTPVEARRDERRQHPRVAVDLPLYAGSWGDSIGGARPLTGAIIVDLSIGGLRLSTWDAADVDSELYLQIELGGDLIEVAGRVAAVRPVPDSELFNVSVQFTELDPRAFEAIGRFVNIQLRNEIRGAA